MALVTVTKCHGTGNDFVLLDARDLKGVEYPLVAKQLCHRRFSIGADGLLVIERASARSCDAGMRIFNSDGSEAQMCGNGIRCVSAYLHGERPEKREYDIETRSGIVHTEIVSSGEHPAVRVCMGVPEVTSNAYSWADSFRVSIGNVHAVTFASTDLDDVNLEQLAQAINEGEPGGINVEVAVVRPDGLRLRIHERGVGETWACGTGACAAAAAAISSGRVTSPVSVISKGGAVEVEWAGKGKPVFLTGEAHLVFRTEVQITGDRASPVAAS